MFTKANKKRLPEKSLNIIILVGRVGLDWLLDLATIFNEPFACFPVPTRVVVLEA